MEKELFSPAGITIMDGALGTMLQAAGLRPGECLERFSLEQADALEAIHKAYVEAGAQVICANTFGTNARKLAGSGIGVAQAVEAAVGCARRAAAGCAMVALDVGPIGEMMEPGGSLGFEEAYGIFKELMQAGEAAGADLILIETMTDLYEVKAAVLAARENTSLPVLASMSFEEDGRTFSGVPVEAFATAIGGLRPAGLGINCSLGPAQVMPLLQRLCDATSLPVFAKPNNGLPDPATGKYSLTADEFVKAMLPCVDMGVGMAGGCCGTTPETIRALSSAMAGKRPVSHSRSTGFRVCGYLSVVQPDGPVAVGERINPTGKKQLAQALLGGDMSLLQAMAVQQEKAGAAILGVNVGAAGVDEVAVLPMAVRAVQAVCGLPLQLDSANPTALAAALRVCNGKPIVNSTDGTQEKLELILPLCRKYGAAVVGLAMDEGGIPETAGGRLEIARRIVDAAQQEGIPQEDVIIDCLTLSAGAMQDVAAETPEAVRLVKEKLGVKTMLGVSNISYGLPQRPLINRSFLAMALQAGLDLPIMNPADSGMMDTLAAYRLLSGSDRAGQAFIETAAARSKDEKAPATPAGQAVTLGEAVERGLKKEAAEAARQMLEARPGEGLTIVNEEVIPALDRVGKGFEEKRVFLPQLLSAAGAVGAAFEVIRQSMGAEDNADGPPVVVATVQGDVHDIGKNIAKTLLQNYGFAVTDLGRDVPPEAVVEAARSTGAKLVGLSALMTTTLPAMERTIKALRDAGLECKILVGGAVLTEAYAREIGADCCAKDAMQSAEYAKQVYEM